MKQNGSHDGEGTSEKLAETQRVLYGPKTSGERERTLLKEPIPGEDASFIFKSPLPPSSSSSMPTRPLPSSGVEKRQKQFPGERCGVCRVGGGDLIFCTRCIKPFHLYCHYPSVTNNDRHSLAVTCKSCSGGREFSALEGGQFSDSPALAGIKVIEDSPGGEPTLNKEDLDSLMSESSFDGILQWAFQNMSRPLSDAPSFFC